MSFKLSLTVPAKGLDALRADAADLADVEVVEDEGLRTMAFSPMSLAELGSLTLAVYATTFEPVLPLIRRAMTRKHELVLTTRYGTLRIRADAPLSDRELMQAIRPLLPKP